MQAACYFVELTSPKPSPNFLHSTWPPQRLRRLALMETAFMYLEKRLFIKSGSPAGRWNSHRMCQQFLCRHMSKYRTPGRSQTFRFDQSLYYFTDVEVDEIYNLACPSPIHDQRDPVQTTTTSVRGAINMLRFAKRLKASILQTSTSERTTIRLFIRAPHRLCIYETHSRHSLLQRNSDDPRRG